MYSQWRLIGGRRNQWSIGSLVLRHSLSFSSTKSPDRLDGRGIYMTAVPLFLPSQKTAPSDSHSRKNMTTGWSSCIPSTRTAFDEEALYVSMETEQTAVVPSYSGSIVIRSAKRTTCHDGLWNPASGPIHCFSARSSFWPVIRASEASDIVTFGCGFPPMTWHPREPGAAVEKRNGETGASVALTDEKFLKSIMLSTGSEIDVYMPQWKLYPLVL